MTACKTEKKMTLQRFKSEQVFQLLPAYQISNVVQDGGYFVVLLLL